MPVLPDNCKSKMAVKMQRILINVHLFLFCMLPPFCLFSQGEFNQWRFGNNAGLNFNVIPPASVSGSAMQTINSPVSVSDSVGNLLFYSDGATVWNRNNQIMPNGSGLYAFVSNGHVVYSVKSL